MRLRDNIAVWICWMDCFGLRTQSIYIYTHTSYIHACKHTHTHIYIYTYIHTYTHLERFTHVYIYIYTQTYIYIYMAVGATGAAFLAHLPCFPQFYCEISRCRDAAVAPHSFLFFWIPIDQKWFISAEISLFLMGGSSALQKGAFFAPFHRRMSTLRWIGPEKLNIPRVSVAFHLRCDRNPGNVKLFGVNSSTMSIGSDKV